MSEARITITVRAEGALARLAHDIRLEATGGSFVRDGETVRARFPVSGIRVVSTSRHGKDLFAPPPLDDAREIEERIRSVALAGGDVVLVTASRDSIEVRAPRGRQRVVPRELDVQEGVRTIVRGECTLSLAALGTGEIRIPLGAVRVNDAIDVDFLITLDSTA